MKILTVGKSVPDGPPASKIIVADPIRRSQLSCSVYFHDIVLGKMHNVGTKPATRVTEYCVICNLLQRNLFKLCTENRR